MLLTDLFLAQIQFGSMKMYCDIISFIFYDNSLLVSIVKHVLLCDKYVCATVGLYTCIVHVHASQIVLFMIYRTMQLFWYPEDFNCIFFAVFKLWLLFTVWKKLTKSKLWKLILSEIVIFNDYLSHSFRDSTSSISWDGKVARVHSMYTTCTVAFMV